MQRGPLFDAYHCEAEDENIVYVLLWVKMIRHMTTSSIL